MAERETVFTPFSDRCGGTTARDFRNLKRVMWLLGAWAVSFAGISQLLKRDLLPTGAISWVAAALPTVAGILVFLAFRRFLREADELQRMVQLRALALGFGATWIAIFGYPLFESLGAPGLDVTDYGLVMAVAYSLGSVIGWRQYR